jgi:hypothetical protein
MGQFPSKHLTDSLSTEDLASSPYLGPAGLQFGLSNTSSISVTQGLSQLQVFDEFWDISNCQNV